MAEKQPDFCGSPEKRPVLLSSGSSSVELSTTTSSDLQPFTLGRVASSVASPSNLSSYTVPVRLDVLYFLLNSAARGAQNALPSLPAHCGQGSFSTCSTQPPVNSCRCCSHSMYSSVPSCGGITYPIGGPSHVGAPQGGYGGQGVLGAGVPGNQNSGYGWVNPNQQGDGKGWPSTSQPFSANVWRSGQSAGPRKEDQREEGAGRSNRGSWQSRRPGNGRSWGDRRQGATGASCPWEPGAKSWRREGSPFGSGSGSGGRNQDWNRRQMPQDIPEAKRRPDDVRAGWQKNQGKLELTSSFGKVASAGPAKPSLIQTDGENWDMDYESKQTSSVTQSSVSQPAPQKNQEETPKKSDDWESKGAPSSDLPELRPGSSSLLGVSKDPGSSTIGKASSGSHADLSKSSGFANYLKRLYSDLPGKSSSEGSTDLVIDTDVESSKPSEEEQSPKNADDNESKACK